MERALALITVFVLASPAVRSQDLLWSNHYGGPYHEFGNACAQASDGDVYVLGSTFSYGNGSFDIYLVRVDSIGNRISSATFGSMASAHIS